MRVALWIIGYAVVVFVLSFTIGATLGLIPQLLFAPVAWVGGWFLGKWLVT